MNTNTNIKPSEISLGGKLLSSSAVAQSLRNRGPYFHNVINGVEETNRPQVFNSMEDTCVNYIPVQYTRRVEYINSIGSYLQLEEIKEGDLHFQLCGYSIGSVIHTVFSPVNNSVHFVKNNMGWETQYYEAGKGLPPLLPLRTPTKLTNKELTGELLSKHYTVCGGISPLDSRPRLATNEGPGDGLVLPVMGTNYTDDSEMLNILTSAEIGSSIHEMLENDESGWFTKLEQDLWERNL